MRIERFALRLVNLVAKRKNPAGSTRTQVSIDISLFRMSVDTNTNALSWSYSPEVDLTHVTSLFTQSYIWRGTWKHQAEVEFTKGDNKVKKLFDASTFQELLKQIQAFLSTQNKQIKE